MKIVVWLSSMWSISVQIQTSTSLESCRSHSLQKRSLSIINSVLLVFYKLVLHLIICFYLQLTFQHCWMCNWNKHINNIWKTLSNATFMTNVRIFSKKHLKNTHTIISKVILFHMIHSYSSYCSDTHTDIHRQRERERRYPCKIHNRLKLGSIMAVQVTHFVECFYYSFTFSLCSIYTRVNPWDTF